MQPEVKSMLFRKDIARACAYCTHAARFDEAACVCDRKGIVPSDSSCRRFRYDPLKRVPSRQKPADFSEYDEVDFSL